jgi:hypothetical protein
VESTVTARSRSKTCFKCRLFSDIQEKYIYLFSLDKVAEQNRYRVFPNIVRFFTSFHQPDPDSDPDPAIFVIDLKVANKKIIFKKSFSADYFSEVHLHNFSNIESPKEVKNSRNQGFSYYFCLMIEGSGAGSGSIPLTNGSGSRRPKNMWTRIRIRIRIRETAFHQL